MILPLYQRKKDEKKSWKKQHLWRPGCLYHQIIFGYQGCLDVPYKIWTEKILHSSEWQWKCFESWYIISKIEKYDAYKSRQNKLGNKQSFSGLPPTSWRRQEKASRNVFIENIQRWLTSFFIFFISRKIFAKIFTSQDESARLFLENQWNLQILKYNFLKSDPLLKDEKDFGVISIK